MGFGCKSKPMCMNDQISFQNQDRAVVSAISGKPLPSNV